MEKRQAVPINSELMKELRRYAFEKHGTTYGAIKSEVEEAIKRHIRDGGKKTSEDGRGA